MAAQCSLEVKSSDVLVAAFWCMFQLGMYRAHPPVYLLKHCLVNRQLLVMTSHSEDQLMQTQEVEEECCLLHAPAVNRLA